MSKEDFLYHLKVLCSISEQNGWGDPLNYGRSREIDLAIKLGHTISNTLSGADAYDTDGNPIEYKTTTQNNIQGTYNGISVQSSWEDQEKYLINEKIGKYKRHYFARYVNADVMECWYLTDKQVLDYVLPRLKIQFENTKTKKDPRLGITIPTDIIRTGEFVDV